MTLDQLIKKFEDDNEYQLFNLWKYRRTVTKKLRQQADRIVELEKQLQNMSMDATPQTKPLTDEESIKLWDAIGKRMLGK